MKLFAIGFSVTVAITLCVSPIVTPTWGQTPTPTWEQTPPSTEEPLPPSDEPLAPSEEPLLPEATSTVYLPVITRGATQNPPPPPGDYGDEWSMVAANPQRTSWTPEQVSNVTSVIWHRPIEAYIPQNVQLIASEGLIFVSTSKGLYALNSLNGLTVWQYDTAMPLGNSPTVKDGILYVGGYDRKIHALNATTGTHLWEYSGALAGYDTNPLVMDGRIFAGNRDGAMYAIGAHGTSNQGRLLWKYQTGGPIHTSAAFLNGVIYFTADDNYAYALRADNGALVWKSSKMPGDGYHSYWPVVFQDKVIFSAALSYRHSMEPGSYSVLDPSGSPYPEHNYMQRNDLFPNDPPTAVMGPEMAPENWSHGFPIIDVSRITEYYESNPQTDPYKHKPWRRTYVALNTSDGSEYTFDSDRDGYKEYLPAAYWGTKSGNRYPPIVGTDGILYLNNLYNNNQDGQGKVMGWKIGTAQMSVIGGQAAVAEPQAISMGGTVIYRNLCCDRSAYYFDTYEDGIRRGELWSYDLHLRIPGYNPMWTILPGLPNLHGWYKGTSNSFNGIYHNHGDQNPIIPYNGHLYVHRSNTIIAFGTEADLGQRPVLTIQDAPNNTASLTVNELEQRLETEVQKIINAGHLRPGYYNNGQFNLYRELADYFDNPGDTLYTLAIAYPHLSPQLQTQTRSYLQREFQDYFDPTMYAKIGWADGAAREAMPLPPEIQADLSTLPKSVRSTVFSWDYPQHNFYAMWKYVQIFPEQAGRAYDLAKSKLIVPVPSIATTAYFRERPFEQNAYIAGYYGFLRLQELAGKTVVDAQLRTSVNNELQRLNTLRATAFEKDSPWGDDRYHKRSLIVAMNFMMMVPELGDYLAQNARSKVLEAVNEYEYVAPYWFVARYEAMPNEGVMSPLYNYSAMFQAKAYILKESRAQLTKYLDVPGFERGDLLYIQNLVAAILAP